MACCSNIVYPSRNSFSVAPRTTPLWSRNTRLPLGSVMALASSTGQSGANRTGWGRRDGKGGKGREGKEYMLIKYFEKKNWINKKQIQVLFENSQRKRERCVYVSVTKWEKNSVVVLRVE